MMGELDRRSFLGGCACVAAMLGVGGLASAVGRIDDGMLRPPGGQDEARLASACVRCDRCRSVCPRGVIGVASIESGLVNARTPVIDFHKGYCDFCDKCAQVCPTGAIRAFDEAEEKIGVAIVQRDRCLAYFNGCVVCAGACEYGAVAVDGDGHPVVDAARCNGCGRCVDVCPALVYRSFSGGARRGIEVVAEKEYERLGKTFVDDGSEMSQR